MRKYIIISLLLFSRITELYAQENKSASDQLPSWVAMIDNPTTNYYHATKVFNSFWANRIKPEEDAEKGKETPEQIKERNEYRAARAKMSSQERASDDVLNYQYKRFRNWINEVKPYVQEDGSIMSLEERMAISKQQQSSQKK